MNAPGERVFVDVAARLQRAVDPQGEDVQVVHLRRLIMYKFKHKSEMASVWMEENTSRSSTCSA